MDAEKEWRKVCSIQYMHELFNEIYDLSGFCIYRPLKDGVEQGVKKR
jgi:hypothetical protein